MRFAICDDDAAFAHALEAHFAACALAIDTEVYASGEELLRDYAQNGRRYDALFLDMEMGGMNGIATANAIRALDRRVIIVFVTSHTKYMRESFQCQPLDFLVKPVEPGALDQVLAAVVRKVEEERLSITFSDNRKMVRLYCDEIVYCESDGHWVELHTATEVFRTRMTLTVLEGKLTPGLFARASKSYLVNLDQVRTIEGYALHLRDSNTVLSLGRAYVKSFKQALLVRHARRLSL